MTRSPGVKRSASAAQLPTTAGGAITSAGPELRNIGAAIAGSRRFRVSALGIVMRGASRLIRSATQVSRRLQA